MKVAVFFVFPFSQYSAIIINPHFLDLTFIHILDTVRGKLYSE